MTTGLGWRVVTGHWSVVIPEVGHGLVVGVPDLRSLGGPLPVQLVLGQHGETGDRDQLDVQEAVPQDKESRLGVLGEVGEGTRDLGQGQNLGWVPAQHPVTNQFSTHI